jgi:hypothetical protein
MCALEEDRWHWRIFCGPRVLKEEFMIHKCTKVGCPLNERIIMKELGEDKTRMDAFHAALDNKVLAETLGLLISIPAPMRPPSPVGMCEPFCLTHN